MNSKLTIEMNFDKGSPYIRAMCDPQSDDVRDKMVRRFVELFGHTSRWCHVRFDVTGIGSGGRPYIEIEPISQNELESNRDEMTSVVNLVKEWETQTPQTVS